MKFFILSLCSIGLWVISPVAWADTPKSSVMIFVSFSMPKESLKEWMMEANEIHAPLIIRGLVKNSFKETTNQVASLLTNHQGGVQLDPELFKRFGIRQVPAVVVTDTNCLPSQTCTFDVIYGDVTLAYALEKIAHADDTVSSHAQEIVNLLHEGKHV